MTDLQDSDKALAKALVLVLGEKRVKQILNVEGEEDKDKDDNRGSGRIKDEEQSEDDAKSN